MTRQLGVYLLVSAAICLVALSDLRPFIVGNVVIAESMRAETTPVDIVTTTPIGNFPDAAAALAAASMAGPKPYLEQ